jgi:hypothetical protein
VSDAPTSPTVTEAAASGGSGDIVTSLEKPTDATTASVTNICVKATKVGAAAGDPAFYAGPGAAQDGKSCK